MMADLLGLRRSPERHRAAGAALHAWGNSRTPLVARELSL
jgi:hypothetical protein